METVLGFDTSTAVLSVGVLAGGRMIGEIEVGADPSGRPRHAPQLLPSVESAVAEAGGWDEVTRIGVGIGPGTFTGLRIGISTARALAQSRDLPLAGISSLRALAAGASPGPVLAVIDAKRKEAFAALYGPDGTQIWEPWVGEPGELARRVSELGELPLAVGDGSVRFRDELEAAGARVPADEDPMHRLAARNICRLAAEAEAGPFELVTPTYLRRPDAELWRERDRKPKSDP